MRGRSIVILFGAGLLCASSQAAPILFGSFNISGNVTVSNPGFNGCPAATQCLTWTDPPATTANKADIAGSGLTGAFAGIAGFSGNDMANISTLQNPPAIVDGAGFPPQLFMSFNAPGVTTTLLTNFIAGGIYSSAQCAAAPAVGQVCTPPGSLFNLVNNPPAAPAGPQATATWVLTGVTNDGQSTWVGNFTSQFGVPYQTLLAQLTNTGSVTNSYSATFTVTQNPVVPEPTTLLLMSSGLLAVGLWKRRTRS